jgi:imidazolonepropionase-like amidohydrolase
MRILCFAIVFSLTIKASAQKADFDVLITNTNFIDVNRNKVVQEKDIVIKDGNMILTKVNPKDITCKKVINGRGKYIMSALYDMHVHFPDQNAERFFQLQTAAGITNCRIMKSTKETVAFTKKAKKIPSMKISYNFFANVTYNIDSIPLIIKTLKGKGYDFIKVFGVKDEAHFDAIMASAKANDIMVCGHALGKVLPAKKLLVSGYKSIEHLGYFDKANTPEAVDSLIDLAVKNNVFVCPTLDWVMMAYHAVPKDSFQYRAGYAIGNKLYANVWDTTYENAHKQLGTQAEQYKKFAIADIAKKIDILSKMRAKGVKIIAGSDAEEPYQTSGFSLLDELKLIQRAGFSNSELLQMITTNADLFWNKKTKQTDYILLSKNPLENIENIGTVEYVIKGSEVIDTKKLLESIK